MPIQYHWQIVTSDWQVTESKFFSWLASLSLSLYLCDCPKTLSFDLLKSLCKIQHSVFTRTSGSVVLSLLFPKITSSSSTEKIMKPISKIAILGGTGKSGKYLVQHLLNQGFQLRLLLRNPETFTIKSPLIEVVSGDARNYESVQTLLEDCQAVISTVGQPKGEPSIFSDATRNVIRAMAHWKIDRYISATGLNVDTPEDQKGEPTQSATDWMRIHYPMTTADKQTEYELLSASSVNWTLVRLPVIEQTDERRPTLVSLADCPGSFISATDLAHFFTESLSDPTYFKKAPFIANEELRIMEKF